MRAIWKQGMRARTTKWNKYFSKNSNASGQPAHPHSLARSIAICFHNQEALIKLQRAKLLASEALLFAYVTQGPLSHDAANIILPSSAAVCRI